VLDGGGGIDTASYAGASGAIAVDLSITTAQFTGAAGTDTLLSIENLVGSSFADNLRGDGNANQIDGGGGADILNGGAGNDRLILRTGANGSNIDGGADIDTLVISTTVSSLAGFTGIEALEFSGGAGLTLTGTQFLNGLAYDSTISGSGALTVNMDPDVYFFSTLMTFTGAVSLVINGTSGVDIIKMGNSVNTINAGDGTDQIRGGNLVDTINGGGGGDKIMGRGGADVITGGLGDDRFRYIDNADSGFGAARDRITDFTSGQDLIDFSWFDGDAVTAGDQAFNFLGTAAFTNTGIGQLRYATSGGDILLQADTNGDGVADMEIILQGIGASTLTAADFIL
jgi:serralysin